jgi:hypothetical protein
VHEGELGGESLIGQIGVERFELKRRDHALVGEGAGRERHEVHLELALGALAQTVGQAVEHEAAERSPLGVVVAARDEELPDRRHGGPSESPEFVGADGHLAPAQDAQPFALGDVCDAGDDGVALRGVDGQERVAHGIVSDRWQVGRTDRAQEVVGDLREDSCTVARTGIGSDRAAVLEVAQCAEGCVDDVVPRGSAERGHHREAAGVFLSGRIVQTLRGGEGTETGV